MTKRDFLKLGDRLLTDLPGSYIRGPMIVGMSINHVLRGLYFESSAFDKKSFYVWVFFLPLFVPVKHVSFNFGKRLHGPSGGERWTMDTPNLVEILRTAVKHQALPFLSEVETPEDVANVVSASQTSEDPYSQQAIAYAWARAGEIGKATNKLQELVRLLDLKVPWQSEIAERAKMLNAKLLEDPVDAQRQLETWEAETLKNLQLEKSGNKSILE